MIASIAAAKSNIAPFRPSAPELLQDTATFRLGGDRRMEVSRSGASGALFEGDTKLVDTPLRYEQAANMAGAARVFVNARSSEGVAAPGEAVVGAQGNYYGLLFSGEFRANEPRTPVRDAVSAVLDLSSQLEQMSPKV